MQTTWPHNESMPKPKGRRFKARHLEKEIIALAAKTGRPVTHGVIDRITMSMIYAEGAMFIEPAALKIAEFMGIPFTCVDRLPKHPNAGLLVLYCPVV